MENNKIEISKVASDAIALLAGAHHGGEVLVKIGMWPGCRSVLESSCNGHQYELFFNYHTGWYLARASSMNLEALAPTMVDSSRCLYEVQANSLEELRSKLPLLLASLPSWCYGHITCLYQPDFAEFEATKGLPSAGRIKQLIYGPRASSPELWEFTRDLVDTAATYRPFVPAKTSFTLCFSPYKNRSLAVYVTVKSSERGLSIEIDDRLAYLWKQRRRRCLSVAAAGEKIANYLCRKHGEIGALAVSYVYQC